VEKQTSKRGTPRPYINKQFSNNQSDIMLTFPDLG
jgi:hypothetical protein